MVLDAVISDVNLGCHSLVRVPSTFLLHVDVEVVEGSLGLGQAPVRVVRSAKAAIASVKSLTVDGKRGRIGRVQL